MNLQYEAIPLAITEEGLTHVRDMANTERNEANRRLNFITARLGNKALENIDLGVDVSDFDLVA